ncbi:MULTISPECIES: hypothetical protein [unclassified Pseudoalteromonas]|uniref:hypothetical protein n=1 Tax=unclassified Pseudoalteromonas TaxID=194690 RepID=UPI0011083ED9|nr:MULTISPECIES: hypothetical protein [unclassified Pseudoalteromonas]MCO7251350.1 hypothetical protein [Pseudoalteromonas sp. Ps84H-4]TMO43177.1 hypothetical protein CWC25_13305 [Pseudoalteromonas sp. S4389]
MATPVQQILDNRTTETESKTNTTQLKAVEGKKIPKGLAEIRALRSNTKRTPGYIFDAVLTKQQRAIVCFSAGLKPHCLNMSFYKFDVQERKAVHRALVQLQGLLAAFTDANVLMPEKFERTQPKFEVVPHLVAEQQTNTQTH